MKGYELLEDAKSHFVLQAPNGARVKIAKNGLSQETLGKIQKFAAGGEVKVEYGASKENTLNPPAVDAFKKAFSGEKPEEKPKIEGKKVAQYAEGTPEGGVPDPEETPSPKPVEINLNLGQNAAPQVPAQEPQGGGPNQTSQMLQALEAAYQKGQQAAAQPVAQPVNAEGGNFTGFVQPAVGRMPASNASPRNALAGLAPQGAQPDVIKQVSALAKTPTSGEAQAISQLVRGQQEDINTLDQQQRDTEKAYQAGYGESSDFVKKINEHEARYNQISQDLTTLGKQMANHELKPKTMFSGGNFLQNIGTALSVLAGGVSQGLTGAKSNPVMDYINTQIDKDVERQKHEYGKLQNQYTILKQAGANEAEAINLLKAQQFSTITAMLHMNEQRTKNLQVKSALKQAQAATVLQAQTYAKQAAIEQTLRANLEGKPSQPQYGMQSVSQQMGGGESAGPNPEVGKKFEQIAQSIPYLVKDEKLVPKVVEEVQRVRSVHEQADDILKTFDAAANAQSIGNRVFSKTPWREPAEISALRQLSIPLIKTKEGTPREFEAHALEKLFPAIGDSAERIKIKREGWKKFIQEGSTSALLDSQQIPYPKLKLGGRKLD